jgi:aspartyl protease family protein
MLPRLAIFCAAIAFVALAAPSFAPRLLATYFRADQAATATTGTARSLSDRKVAIDSDPRGHFITDAVIDGRTISVMVDTGATTVALTTETARRLGLNLAPADYTARVSTANGIVAAAPVTLHEVRVGAIAVRDVAAVVVEGDALGINLLGMTFLRHLSRFESAGGPLVLTE